MRSALGVVLLVCACAPLTVDHSPRGDVLDAESTTLDPGVGQWVPWFNTAVSHHTDSPAVGSGSLGIEVTRADGWGVYVNNFPGYAAGAGRYRAEVWLRVRAGEAPAAALELRWRGAEDSELEMATVPCPGLSSGWQHFQADVVAPAGTRAMGIAITGTTGDAGPAVDADEVRVIPE